VSIDLGWETCKVAEGEGITFKVSEVSKVLKFWPEIRIALLLA
jgi:hypothetical protein